MPAVPAGVVEVVDDILPKRFRGSPGALDRRLWDFHSSLSESPGAAPGAMDQGVGFAAGGIAVVELRTAALARRERVAEL